MAFFLGYLYQFSQTYTSSLNLSYKEYREYVERLIR
jgi:hypothetical protein